MFNIKCVINKKRFQFKYIFSNKRKIFQFQFLSVKNYILTAGFSFIYFFFILIFLYLFIFPKWKSPAENDSLMWAQEKKRFLQKFSQKTLFELVIKDSDAIKTGILYELVMHKLSQHW